MRKLWAVTSGDYSDYRVNALFETEELANEVAKIDPGLDVEEFDLYAEVPQRRVYTHIRASRYRDYTGDHPDERWYIHEQTWVRWPWDGGTEDPYVVDDQIRDTSRANTWWFSVEGYDGEAVRRKFADMIRTLNDRLALMPPKDR